MMSGTADIQSKTARYSALVEKRKTCRACVGLTNPSAVECGAFDSSEIGPWSLWQGNLNAPIVVIGQDWGDVAYFTKWHGNDILAANPTNKNLQHLLTQFGIDIQLTGGNQKQEIFLTNLILCMKDGGLQAPVQNEWCTNCSERMLSELLDIIQPVLVITLGFLPAKAVLDLYRISYRKSWPLHRLMQAAPFKLFGNTWLYPVYHCGNSGVNRNRALSDQEVDWHTAATHYHSLSKVVLASSERAMAQDSVDTGILNSYLFVELSNESLTLDSVPVDGDWDEPSAAQDFALSFDGYQWAEQNQIELGGLFQNARRNWKDNQLSCYSLSELRAILFALQRHNHDSWERPDPEFVSALLDAIRDKIASQLRTESQSVGQNCQKRRQHR